MIRKALLMLTPLALTMGCSDVPSATEPVREMAPQLSKTAVGGRAGALGVVYVRSQGLYYDTFVSAETLPPHGRFQALESGETDYGPGDSGYLGGRWWIDSNGDGVQDPGDTYLLCPLLPPGRTEP